MNKNPKTNQSYRYATQRPRGIGDRPIRFKCSLQNTIIDVLRSKGWTEVREEETDFDIFWADRGWMKEYFDQCFMQDHVRINHFRNHYELTRKNLMVKNLKRHRKMLEREAGKIEASKCDFFPMTYELPSEYHMFVDEFKKYPGSIWIMKPVAKSQGKGIFLFRKLKDITDWKKSDTYRPREEKNDDKEPVETYIVSKYIEKPYLIGGRKFDLRVYVIVTSYIPLKAWLYRSGFARFSNTRFSLDSIDDAYVHLTNVAIQKTAPDYDAEKGCKWSMPQIKRYFTAKHGIENVEQMFRNINDIFIKSLQSVQKIMINDKHCFELYGYDILIDQDLKPWLIEVNASPSLTASSEEDYILKFGLLEDVLHIIDMEGRMTGKEKRIGGFDLMWDDGPVMAEEGGVDCISPPSYSTNTFLGCHNDRKRQLRQLFKQLAAQRKT
ncbi:probable tubulin polyglutamylase TTLL9 isoform X1 [Lytechinus pictus]|uniref:probable tubulin polyglutamylase TTLL9 isoform X1 n=1 Tax=Lytechinus pictus TaxID=7653 RepID=UPI0030B9AF6D